MMRSDSGEENDGKSDTQKSWVQRLFPAGFQPEFSQLLHLIWPLLLTQLCMALLPVTSLIFCGQLDAQSLAAVSLANSVINVTCLAVGMGLATACDTLFAQSFGGSNKKQVGVYLQKGILLVILACPPCWALHLNTESLLRLIGQEQETSRLAGRYLLYYLPGVLFSFLYQVLSKYIQNQNIVVPSVLIGVVGNGVNALLHWLLVFHLDWRTDGSSLAQVGANVTLCLLTLLYILASKCYKETWPGWSVDCLKSWGVFLKLAIPGMMMLCLEWWCFEIGTILSGTLSTVDLGVQSVIFYMEGICFQIPVGVSIACSIRVGQLLGAGDADGAKTATRLSYFIVSWWATVAVVIFGALRYQVPKIFSNDPTVIDRAADVFPILAAYCVFESLSAVSGGVLRGCGRQVIGAVVIFIGYWVVALPVGIPLMLLTPLTVLGLWIGYASGIFLESIIFTLLVLTTNWDAEAEQAQIRAGVDEESSKPEAITEVEEEEEDDVEREDQEPRSQDLFAFSGQRPRRLQTQQSIDSALPPGSPRNQTFDNVTRHIEVDERTGLLSDRQRRGQRSRSYRRGSLPYSSSNVVTLLHGRRFSAATISEEQQPLIVPNSQRRFSTKYTPQIQLDILRKLQTQQVEDNSTIQLVLQKLLAFMVSLAFLGAGVVIRLYVSYPYDAAEMCIPWPSGNVTLPPNISLPLCNTTTISPGPGI